MAFDYKLTPTSLTLFTNENGIEHYSITPTQFKQLSPEYDDGSQVIVNQNYQPTYAYFKSIVEG